MDSDSLSLRSRSHHFENNNDNTLKTFYSQVGGHVNMKKLGEKFVCKPLNRREAKFYQNLPKQLYDLVPKYHGTVLGSHAQENSYSYER